MSHSSNSCANLDVLRRELDLVDAGAKFFSDLFEYAPLAMLVIDASGRVHAANVAACRLYLVDKSELERLRLPDLLPHDLDVSRAAQQLVERGEAALEFSETARDGTSVDMRIEARSFQTGRYLVSLRDVTREKRAERELERAHEQRSFGEAAAAVVHDVNNLLVPIFCYTDVLAQREPHDAELRRSILEIRDAAERAASLACKLLSIAELTAEKPTEVHVNTLLERMADMLARLVGSRIELSLDLDPTAGAVRIDRERLERLLLNLVLNARDAMPNGGELTIATLRVPTPGEESAKRSGSLRRYVTVCVADTGVGMDHATRERIFEPFFTTKSGQGGTGLGLSSALSFVGRNNGSIDVDSEPGRGTRFRISFPEIDEREPR